MSSACHLAFLGHQASHLHHDTSDLLGDTAQSVGGTNILKQEHYFWAVVLPSPGGAVKNATMLEAGRQGHAEPEHLPQGGHREVKG